MASASGLFIGLDVGTQSTKGVLIDAARPASNAIVARASSSYDLIAGLPAGAAEQHPHTWRDAVISVLAELLRGVNPEQLRGIGVSGQQHGLVVLNGKDEVVRPAKLWCDTTTADEAAAITNKSGRSVPSGFTIPKLLWLKKNEPENFAQIETVLLPHDYINFLLSGQKFMEAGDASGSGAFDPTTRSIDREILSWIDPRAPQFFPQLVSADFSARVSAQGAQLFGLPEGLLISPGGGDNMMSAIGSGATHAGATVISLGTSGTAFAYSETPVIDPAGDIAAFCDSTGAWMPLLCTMNVTLVTEEVRTSFGLDHKTITQLAAQVPAGCDGLMFLPYLSGERVPNLPHATGTLLGIRPTLLKPGHLFRAAIEGATFGLASGINKMKSLGLKISAVSVVGGGSKNPLWRQIIADMLNVPVVALSEPEAAALGGAIQALWIYRRQNEAQLPIHAVAAPYVQTEAEAAIPDPNRSQVYQKLLKQFESETQRLYS